MVDEGKTKRKKDKVHNTELHTVYFAINIFSVLKSRRIQFEKRVARVDR